MILIRNAYSAKNFSGPELIDFNPQGTLGGTHRHPGLEAGESYTAPDGLFAIKVASATSTSASVQISFPGLAKTTRWAGADRYAASASISQASFAPGVATAYLASGEVYTDALSGAPVAGMTDLVCRPGPPLQLRHPLSPPFGPNPRVWS